tara:strand:+ start:418 stop:783 length:366 start_codon:yes stop_codon:yes gene_type:complete
MVKTKIRLIGLTVTLGLVLSGCSNLFNPPGPNEFLVEESRALAIPPDFDLAPPSEAARNDVPNEDDTPGIEPAPSDLEIASRSVEGATAEDPEELAKRIKEEKDAPKPGKSGFQRLIGSIF